VADQISPIYLATAVQAVVKAGAMQLAGIDHLQVEKKGAIDLVTQIDRDVERMFRALIAERFPDHAVLAEEFEVRGDRQNEAEYCWVFDPVDGTTNFAHGLPIFCSTLALEIGGVATVGAIYDPTRKELFTAERGQGAWLNGAPIHVSSGETLIDSLLVTGFHYDVQRDPAELMELFSDFIRQARAVRRLGSAALDLAYVGCGRFEGFWEQKLQPWDVAAGALIVAEAGGRVTDLAGQEFQSRAGNVVASNGRIHDQMLETIRRFRERFHAR
jgi:myo-inositol-1(or 4)-monophosphatase